MAHCAATLRIRGKTPVHLFLCRGVVGLLKSTLPEIIMEVIKWFLKIWMMIFLPQTSGFPFLLSTKCRWISLAFPLSSPINRPLAPSPDHFGAARTALALGSHGNSSRRPHQVVETAHGIALHPSSGGAQRDAEHAEGAEPQLEERVLVEVLAQTLYVWHIYII